MKKINNKKAIRKLSVSSMKTNARKYILLVVAVALTSLMFTSIFTILGSLFYEVQLSYLRQYGSDAHAGYFLSPAEYEKIKNDPAIKMISYDILVGEVRNVELGRLQNQVFYSEPESARMNYCYPETGMMPKEENEIVTSDLVLEKLGVPAKIGSHVPLTINIGGEEITGDFILSGYFRGDIISDYQSVLVSKAFQEKYAPLPDDYVVPGRMFARFKFSNSFNIFGKVKSLSKRNDIGDDVPVWYNMGYFFILSNGIDFSMVSIIVLLLFTVFLSGYLIIYNIFYINVLSDIREYGLLKTIGTTGKQLKKIVRKRAALISIIGIPLGMAPGIIAGALLLPKLSDEINTVSFDKGQVYMNIWILLGSALFSYVTVLVSASKPCKMAGQVSPIEAVRLTDSEVGSKRGKKIVVVMSLSLALVVLNNVFSIANSFTGGEDLLADYFVQDTTLDNPGVSNKVFDGVTKEFLQELSLKDDVEEIGNVYICGDQHIFKDSDWKKLQERVLENDSVKSTIESDYDSDTQFLDNLSGSDEYNSQMYMEDLNRCKSLDGLTYGINKMIADKLIVLETEDGSNTIDWEKFNSGQYVLVNNFPWTYDDEPIVTYFEPGDKVYVQSMDEKYIKYEKCTTKNGEVYEIPSMKDAPYKEYEVLGVVNIPYDLGCKAFGEFECDFYLPENEFLALNGDRQPARTVFNVKDGKKEDFEVWINNYTHSVNRNLEYVSEKTYMEDYNSYRQIMKTCGILLAVLLGLIGVINFANTMISTIQARAHEMAMLEAVGMTGKQQKRKLISEGLIFFLWTAVVSIVLSSIMSIYLIKNAIVNLEFFNWKFTIFPVLVALAIIAVIIAVIPCVAYEKMRKVSVVDRLREE